jgi:Ca2+-binding RTX toxin-like protein
VPTRRGFRHAWGDWFRGADRLHGGLGNDTINGGSGRDHISGGKDDDTLNGNGGRDVIFANQGRDRSLGGDGNDVLWALSRLDVTAVGDPDGDELHGDAGNDLVRVRDGERDVVECGDGRDKVISDQFDQIAPDCERVEQRDITSLDQVDDGAENREESAPQDDDQS